LPKLQFQHLAGGTETYHENVGQETLSSDQGSNAGLSKYKALNISTTRR